MSSNPTNRVGSTPPSISRSRAPNQREATITIRNRTLDIKDGLVGTADVHVTADARTWLGFLAKERRLIAALITRKIRVKGSPKLLLAFGKCFPAAGPRRTNVEIPPAIVSASPDARAV